MIILLNLVAGKINFSSGAKFHGDWCKNGHATRKKVREYPKISAGRRQNILFFSMSGKFISVLRVPEEKLAVHIF